MNWNLLKSEDVGLALVRTIENTAVCDLSASRSDGVTLLHLAAARGYSEMLRYLLERQVKLVGIFFSVIFGRSRGSNWLSNGAIPLPIVL